jgi:hypothetical protein
MAATNEKEIAERRKDLVFFDPAYSDSESDVSDSLLTVDVSMGIDLATQVTAQIHDDDFKKAQSNYFSISRDVFFKTSTVADLGNIHGGTVPLAEHMFMRLEIAAASCAPGNGRNPIWTIELRNKAIQQMRRDKDPASISGSAHDYVINAASKYNLDVVAESTDKTRKINKATSDRAADSVWDVIKNLASDAKFVVFETENILFFGSQKWLLGRWGSHTGSADVFPNVAYHAKSSDNYNYCLLRFPPRPDDVFRPMEMPSMRRSDNDPLEVQGSVNLERASGVALRPGMSVFVDNYPTFEGLYLIDSVEYDHLGTGPVRVSFRSPEREEKEIKQLEVLTEYIDPYEGNSLFAARGF